MAAISSSGRCRFSAMSTARALRGRRRRRWPWIRRRCPRRRTDRASRWPPGTRPGSCLSPSERRSGCPGPSGSAATPRPGVAWAPRGSGERTTRPRPDGTPSEPDGRPAERSAPSRGRAGPPRKDRSSGHPFGLDPEGTNPRRATNGWRCRNLERALWSNRCCAERRLASAPDQRTCSLWTVWRPVYCVVARCGLARARGRCLELLLGRPGSMSQSPPTVTTQGA